MSRPLATAALLAAMVLSSLAGCGGSASTGSGKTTYQTNIPGPAPTDKAADTGKDTAKTTERHHDPG